MAIKLLQRALFIGVVLAATSAELDTERVQKFSFKTATHYRKEYKDRDGKVYGEYGVHMPDGWTRVLVYETTGNKIHRLVQEYRTPSEPLLYRPGGTRVQTPTENEERVKLRTKVRQPSSAQEEIENETEPKIQIIDEPNLWKVRGEDLIGSGSEQLPITQTLSLAFTGRQSTVAPSKLTDQRAIYNFGYDAPHHGHNETGTETGSKFGTFYVDLPNCWRSVVRYWADETGYHPTMRQMKTPGCDQQKREAVSATSEAGKAPSEAGDAPSETGPSAQGQPLTRTGGRPSDPELQQAAEVPAPAQSVQQETVDPSGPSAPSASGRAAATCTTRKIRDGEPAPPGRPYSFAYNTGTHYHWEKGFPNGTKIGAYAVQLPDGTLRTTTYSAGCNGFKPSVTVEPLDESKFLRDFQQFNPPKEAKLFETGGQPQASALVRSKPAPAPENLVRRKETQRSAEVGGAPPRLTLREPQRKTTTTPAPTTTEPTTAPALPTTAAPAQTSASPVRPVGGSRRSRPAVRQPAPIVPLRPVGSGPYHFYVHLRHNYHEERSYENGTVAGQYGVVAPDGVLREVSYTSEHGFVPTLTDTPVSADHDLSTRPRKL